jgi:hypothetical protein
MLQQDSPKSPSFFNNQRNVIDGHSTANKYFISTVPRVRGWNSSHLLPRGRYGEYFSYQTRARWVAIYSILLGFLIEAPSAGAQDEATIGQWSPVMTWPYRRSMRICSLTGKVMWWPIVSRSERAQLSLGRRHFRPLRLSLSKGSQSESSCEPSLASAGVEWTRHHPMPLWSSFPTKTMFAYRQTRPARRATGKTRLVSRGP